MKDCGICGFVMLWITLFSFIISTHCDCGAPPSLPYSILKEEFTKQETFRAGATVQYSCMPGFIHTLGTRNTITCMDNSKWTKSENFCSKISCGYPGDLDNGYFEIDQNPDTVTGFLFGTKVIYYCNNGYKMISSRNYRVCQSDKTWSNVVPDCEVVICPYPKPISGGTFLPVLETYTYMNSIQYKCNSPKAALYGESSIFCTENGTWSSAPPSCTVVECPVPDVSNARKVSGFAPPYMLNSGVTFECRDGYIMHGPSYVKCNIHSEWEPSLPTCQRAFCEIPQIINGKVKGNPQFFHDNIEIGYQVDSTVTLSCNSLYTINGKKQITCGKDFEWHPKIPICEYDLGCSSPNVLNGLVVLKNGQDYFPQRDGHSFSTSDKIEIQCYEDYKLSGSSTSTCTFSWFKYVWSPELPKCQ